MREHLETARLKLKPLGPEHAEVLYGVYSQPEVARFLVSRPESWEDFLAIFNRALRFRESHGMWALFPREGEALIGRVGFFSFGEAERPELAFLLSRCAWGQGFATEACAAALAHAVRRYAWAEVVAIIRPGNTRAARVLEKLGFAPESDFVLNDGAARLYQASRERLDACRPTSECS